MISNRHETAERLRLRRPLGAAAERAASRARALGDPTRLVLAAALADADGELCVCDLAWIAERSVGTVSHHLRLLRAERLAESRRDGKMILYRLTPTRYRASARRPGTDTRAGVTIATEAVAARTPEWSRTARRARLLSWLSLAWMGAEGAVAIVAGVLAGSIALIGFGIDSAIEGIASIVIVWRFTIIVAGQGPFFSGILVSRDGGGTWERALMIEAGAGPAAWSPSDPDVAYAWASTAGSTGPKTRVR